MSPAPTIVRGCARLGALALAFAVAACDSNAPPRNSILASIPIRESKWEVPPRIAAVGDLDGDGQCDLAISVFNEVLGSAGRVAVRAHSGRDGRQLFLCLVTAEHSRRPFAVGDLNGDGVPDIAAAGGAPSSSIGSGEVLLYSGRDGTLLNTLTGDDKDDGFGRAVAGVGDVDGDGRGDLVVVSGKELERLEPWVPGGPSSVHAISGHDGRVLWSIDVAAARGNAGTALCALPDLDGDGVGDVAYCGIQDGHRGYVDVVSGRSGTTIRRLEGETDERRFGAEICAVPDFDADGVAELLVSCAEGVRMYSGASGAVLQVFEVTHWGGFLPVGDVDDDGRSDLVGSSVRGDGKQSTRFVFVASGADGRDIAAREFDGGNPFQEPVVLGDLDGDGFFDLALSTPEHVYVISGRRYFFR